MNVDDHGWLVGAEREPVVTRLPTVRTYALATREPLGAVWHTTDERGGPGTSEAMARRVQTFRIGVDRLASWHLLVSREGAVYQSAPFTVGTWHVGVGGVIAGRRFPNINHVTVRDGRHRARECRAPQAARRAGLLLAVRRQPERAADRAPAGRRLRAAVRARRCHPAGAVRRVPPPPRRRTRPGLSCMRSRRATSGWTREVCAYGHVDFDPEHREAPGPIWKQTVLPRVLDRIFGAAGATASTAGTAGQGASL